jgi:hypothetical protein
MMRRVDGVILSPSVEIFRGGSDHGYPFMQEPAQLAAIISLGMFNQNERMCQAQIQDVVRLRNL